MTIRLFSYGTLQLPEVQLANYGRLLDGQPDVLLGYALVPLEIGDPHVVRISGKAVHTIACATGDAENRVRGVVFEVTLEELAATDRYETDAYGRIEVTLESGLAAFVYVGPPIT